MNSNEHVRSLKLYIDFEEGLLLEDFTSLLRSFNGLYDKLHILEASENQINNILQSLLLPSLFQDKRTTLEKFYEKFYEQNSEGRLAIKKFSEGSLWIELMSNPIVTDELLSMLKGVGEVVRGVAVAVVVDIIKPKLAKIFTPQHPELAKEVRDDITHKIKTDYEQLLNTLHNKKIKKISVVRDDGEEIEIIKKQSKEIN